MEGTRNDILGNISDWVKDSTQPNILWLTGSPGAGKSAIASTIIHRLLKKRHPVIAFFFKRHDAVLGDPAVLWRTIAFELACCDPALQHDIIDVLTDAKVDLDRVDIAEHFSYLVAEPLQRNYDVFSSRQALFIVIDALDECGSSDFSNVQRRNLLHTLKNWTNLPKKFKLLVTARGEADIKKCFDSISHSHIELHTGDLVSRQTSDDICLFLKHEFAHIAEDYGGILPSSWPGMPTINQLTKQAAGLFIWAETAIRFITQGDPPKQLELIQTGKVGIANIDTLYSTILENSFKQPGVHSSFNAVVGAIVLARIPLQQHDLRRLLDGVESETSILFVLRQLQSVILCDRSSVLRISHQSLGEFLTDAKRSKKFAIDKPKQSLRLALACLQIMNKKLHFNICHLETSHQFNDQVADLPQQIKKSISSELSYACCFWAEHLRDTSKQNLDSVLSKQVKTLLHIHLLHWLEVLSLIKEVAIASKALMIVDDWFQVSSDVLLIFVCVAELIYSRPLIQSFLHLQQMPEDL
jgi:hypothetical protein